MNFEQETSLYPELPKEWDTVEARGKIYESESIDMEVSIPSGFGMFVPRAHLVDHNGKRLTELAHLTQDRPKQALSGVVDRINLIKRLSVHHYQVIRIGSGASLPTKTHKSLAEAQREAERLSRLTPDVDFIVADVALRVRSTVTVETTTEGGVTSCD
jgi:hypothetical protein